MLKKANRLLKNADFKQVLSKGRAAATKFFLIKYVKNGRPRPRFGFVISAKVSKKAVERNLLKRRLREIIRRDAKILIGDYDVVFIARRSALNLTFAELKEEIIKLMNKIK